MTERFPQIVVQHVAGAERTDVLLRLRLLLFQSPHKGKDIQLARTCFLVICCDWLYRGYAEFGRKLELRLLCIG